MNESIYTELQKRLPHSRILPDEPLSEHTTFRIGGPADFLVQPSDEEEIAKAAAFCKAESIPFYVIGNGSNLLAADQGFRGVILQLGRSWSDVKVSGSRIDAQSGAMLVGIARTAFEASLTGLEFASGIPGTLGGGVRMNAGAYGGEMKDVVRSVRMLSADGQIEEYPGSRMEFGYRTSIAESGEWIILASCLELIEGDPAKIRARMEELRDQRNAKQPLEKPSAGSTFKRPAGYFAGKLIQDAGLRGFRIGGAQVSEKHCGFVINAGGASAADVRALMHHVQKTVYEQSGVFLEPEVRMIGEFDDGLELSAHREAGPAVQAIEKENCGGSEAGV